ncbi:suppressor of tub2 mutation, variant 2 [Puccinia graminis f. sp. tritici]|uniref:Suppressor of tub2 mutation, variant 2 n=1 Tax=Puccinia graminis f. sp. tritici TaxID=56615 RepID=A0A5B0MBM8_PUCGR|nr:suppressor of tub2 mutation, variant 2 [Puccinia graminis f. sp. tritici]
MSFATIQALEVVITGSDNEKKVLRLNTLRDELETLESPPDLQPLLTSLKSSLDSSNGHLSYAALACLPPLARTLASPAHQSALKQLVFSLYSPASSSVASFLGDAKQRTRETARASLFGAASAACEAHVISQTSPRTDDVLQEIERIVKEQGFASKIARARVQTLYYLSEIRSRYPALIPFKTYLPSLVSLLEDSDVSVRTAASECVTTVFSDPSLPASARGDLKNELAKQGTRRSTVDSILAKVFTTSNPPGNNTTAVGSGADDPPLTQTDNTVRDQAVDSSSNPLANSQTGPPGSEPPPPSGIINPVFVSGPRELESIFAKMLSPWEGKETEHNWQAREANMNTLRGMIKTNVHMQYTADFIAGLKSISEGLLKSLASLRTTMAVGACNAFVELSVLGPALDPLVDIILPPLLRMAAQTKKIVFQASQAAVTALIKSTYHPRVLQYLSACVNEKTVQARIAGVSRIKEFLDFHGQRSKSQIESGGGLGIIEKVLRRSLADASPVVRETAREVFWNCSAIWPQMTSPLIESLDGPTRKQLEKASTGRRAVSSASFKTEKEPSSRISVRSLIKSTRSAHRAAETPNVAKAAPISPRQVANSLGGIESPAIKSTGATSGSGLAHRTPERQNTAQSPRRNDLKRSVSARDPPTGDRSKSSISSPPLGLAISKTMSPHKTSPASPISRIAVRSASTGKNFSPPNQRLQSRKVLSAENIVEDAMKAQAEQAESAAHRLLELTEDENELQPLVPLGPGGVLLPATTRADHVRLTQLAQSNIPKQFQATTNKETMWKQFEDSPRNHLHIAVEEVPKKEIAHRGNKNLWWHRQAELSMCAGRQDASPSDILNLIAQIEEHPPTSQDRQIYLDLSQACYEHRCSIGKVDSTGTIIKSEEKSQMEKNMEFWMDQNLFDRLFEALKEKLKQNVSVEVKDAQLVLLRALILYETMLMGGKETELCELLLLVASEGVSNLIIAVEALGSLWAETSDPVYGLSCLRSCVEIVSQRNLINQASSNQPGSENWMGLAMSCLGGFFCRLPAEIVEEELPKASELIKRALNHRQAEIRMSAVMSLVSANQVIKNDREIFQVLGNLTTAQEALITYYLTPSQ